VESVGKEPTRLFGEEVNEIQEIGSILVGTRMPGVVGGPAPEGEKGGDILPEEERRNQKKKRE